MGSFALDTLVWLLQHLPGGNQVVSTPKEETDYLENHVVSGHQKYGHSSCLSASPVVEEGEDEQTLQQNPPGPRPGAIAPEVLGALGAKKKELIAKRLRLLLVGKTGSGKSATGNSILGREAFESKPRARPVTLACQRGSRVWSGWELDVIDTPDILSPRAGPEAAAGTCEAIALTSPGPHAVLLVTQLGRFTKGDREAVRRLQEIFGMGVLAHTILVFTRKEDLAGGSLGEFLRTTTNRSLHELDVLCERRHCAFNNRAAGAEREAQLRDLMGEVEAVLWESEGQCYANLASRFTRPSLLLPGLRAAPAGSSRERLSRESWREELARVQAASEAAHRRSLRRASV